jgi:hypothetical protein
MIMKPNPLSIYALLAGLALTANAQPITDFEANAPGDEVVFRNPSFSGSTSGNIEAGTSFARVTDAFPAGDGLGDQVYQVSYNLTTPAGWVRLTSFNAANVPNPTVDLALGLSFDIYTDRQIYLTLGLRETGTTADIGANGGSTGGIEWVGGATDATLSPPLGQLVGAGEWTTLTYWFPDGPVKAFAGATADGNLTSVTGKGVLEHLALIAPDIAGDELGVYNIYLDNLVVIPEPSSLVLAGLGLAALAMLRLRRR